MQDRGPREPVACKEARGKGNCAVHTVQGVVESPCGTWLVYYASQSLQPVKRAAPKHSEFGQPFSNIRLQDNKWKGCGYHLRKQWCANQTPVWQTLDAKPTRLKQMLLRLQDIHFPFIWTSLSLKSAHKDLSITSNSLGLQCIYPHNSTVRFGNYRSNCWSNCTLRWQIKTSVR